MYKLELVDVCKNMKLFCMISLTLPLFLNGGQLHWLACNEGGGGCQLSEPFHIFLEEIV